MSGISAENQTNQTEHITPVLQSLHWLPVRQQTLFTVRGGGTLVVVAVGFLLVVLLRLEVVVVGEGAEVVFQPVVVLLEEAVEMAVFPLKVFHHCWKFPPTRESQWAGPELACYFPVRTEQLTDRGQRNTSDHQQLLQTHTGPASVSFKL